MHTTTLPQDTATIVTQLTHTTWYTIQLSAAPRFCMLSRDFSNRSALTLSCRGPHPNGQLRLHHLVLLVRRRGG